MSSWEEVVRESHPLTPVVPFKICPVEIVSGILVKKWTILILRDIGLLKMNRFNQILRSLPGLTPRVLTLRLKELEINGLIHPVIITEKPRVVEWNLTTKGWDTIPILMDLITFGAKWYPEEIFEDCRVRGLEEIYPGK